MCIMKKNNIFLQRRCPTPQLYIFDLDGTLVNTNKANYLAYKYAIYIIKKINIDNIHMKKDRFTRDKIWKIIPDINKLELKRIIELKEAVFHKYIKYTKLKHEIFSVLEGLNNCITILATRSSYTRAHQLLDYYNLESKFDYVFCKEDYRDKKVNKYKYIISSMEIDADYVTIYDDDISEIHKASELGVRRENTYLVSA